MPFKCLTGMSVLPACLWTMCVLGAMEIRQGSRSSRTGGVDGFQTPRGCWEPKLSRLEEQHPYLFNRLSCPLLGFRLGTL